ncbi:pre-mRNA-splicing factor sap145-like isoform X2 [Lotus japonicus]|uniref:pre-mRNA-splicing factor sap145-like isoform X2 n=1 Tax=Lotus japonicus TaxID=34305 RepID=UPI002585896A|nr:pre-mRNA-splicing factor sap145-like isoform X2 [Lotus japonicus]
MQPKMVIDYQVLHDAFFKYQTKPKLTSLGELYHEGKEFEVKLREMKPDMLSHELKEAPGMPEGAPPNYEESVFNTKHWGDLGEKKEEEELEAGTYVFNLLRYEKPRPEEKLRS